MTITPDREQWSAQAERVNETLPRYSPEFQFRVQTYSDYEDLLARRRGGEMKPWGSLLSLSEAKGRLLLSAEGGSGKTSLVARAFRKAQADGWWCVLIDLKTWGGTAAVKWHEAEGRVARLDLLLRTVALPETDELALFSVADGKPRIVFVDGINEVDAGVANDLLAALDEWATRNPMGSVFVTDRLVRRPIRNDRWALASIAPLSDTEIAKYAPSTPGPGELLRTAFFLDIAAKSTVDSSSGARAIHGFLEHHVGLDAVAIDQVSKGAFETYMSNAAANGPSRSFPVEAFRQLVTPQIEQQMAQDGLLVEDGAFAHFRHHLFHDYLASLWLARHPDLWSHRSFDAITFNAGSFDALGLTLEQLVDPNHADRFLNAVYDWNFYAVSYALSKAEAQGVSCVSQEARAVLLTLLAEKTWDPLLATRQRVRDGLQLFSDPGVDRLLSAASLAELVQLVRDDLTIGSSWPDWREIFTTEPGSQASDPLVDRVAEPEPVIGWTVANVLRRVTLLTPQEHRLQRLSDTGTETVRWRVAHVFGAHPSIGNVQALISGLDDEYRWVQYGSIRSLVECAAHSEELRDLIIDNLMARLPQIRSSQPLLSELEKAVLLAEPPIDWPQVVEPVLDALWASAPDDEEQEHWMKLAHEVRHASARG
jgi:hypothetical protein